MFSLESKKSIKNTLTCSYNCKCLIFRDLLGILFIVKIIGNRRGETYINRIVFDVAEMLNEPYIVLTIKMR